MSAVAPFPLDEPSTAIDWIAEVTAIDHREVRRRLSLEHARLGANVSAAMTRAGVEFYVFSDTMAALYASTDAFLYETYTWNRYPTKQRIRQWVIDFLGRSSRQPQRILAYGDGLGFDACGLALAGHSVTYFEVGARSIAFATKVFAANNVSVEMCSDPTELPHDDFDVVLCLDVLEHVPDPPAFVQQLTPHLKAGGLFIAHAPFWYVEPDVSTHLASNRKYCGDWKNLYGAAGLTPVDAEIAWNPLVLAKDDGRRTIPWSRCPSFYLGTCLLRWSRICNWPLTWIRHMIMTSERTRLLNNSPELTEK